MVERSSSNFPTHLKAISEIDYEKHLD